MWATIIAAVIGLVGAAYSARQQKKTAELQLAEQRRQQAEADKKNAAAQSQMAKDTAAANAAIALQQANSAMTSRDVMPGFALKPEHMIAAISALAFILVFLRRR
jgi:hypothetical protein